MNARVIILRPRTARSAGPSSSSPAVPPRPRSSRRRGPVDPVAVEWSDERGAYVACCSRCTDTVLPATLTDAHTWAEEHRCDLEFVALLDAVTGRGVA
ncbi:hypothetical protein [Actinomadura craniellae]|uniref:hypothetical protein n=1 Tax=Actinomadura craniellae TaxID=2231787 RepID=UPI0011BFE113|nr:hypothetical protein [Actinomadura craniellae]